MTTFNTSREIPATAEEVFAAFSHPERLSRWWGPAGFTNTFSVCEFKKSGRWSFIMRGPDGRNYKNESVFAEIEHPGKIVIQHISGPKYRLTILLASSAAGTVVSWSQTFESSEVASRIEHIVVPANEQNLDRLSVEVLHKPCENRDSSERDRFGLKMSRREPSPNSIDVPKQNYCQDSIKCLIPIDK